MSFQGLQFVLSIKHSLNFFQVQNSYIFGNEMHKKLLFIGCCISKGVSSPFQENFSVNNSHCH